MSQRQRTVSIRMDVRRSLGKGRGRERQQSQRSVAGVRQVDRSPSATVLLSVAHVSESFLHICEIAHTRIHEKVACKISHHHQIPQLSMLILYMF